MMKRLIAALVCVAATFAFGGVATAQAQTLTVAKATVLAKRLAQAQVRGRDIVSFHLLKPRRVSSTRLAFPYDDRSKKNVYCTAVLVVSQTTSGRTTTTSARFTGQRCRGIPAEVLKFEAITRQAQRDLRGNTLATVQALGSVRRAERQCRNVRVPRRQRANAGALFDIALVEALALPNDRALAGFATRLLFANAPNTTLRAAAAGWANYVTVVRQLPRVARPCAALKRWASLGYAPSAAPIDFAAFRVLDRRAEIARRAITRGARLLARSGVFPRQVVGFTPDGLLLQLGSIRAIVAGNKEKAVLG